MNPARVCHDHSASYLTRNMQMQVSLQEGVITVSKWMERENDSNVTLQSHIVNHRVISGESQCQLSSGMTPS